MDTIRSVITFNQRNAQTVKDAERFVEMILNETPAFAEGRLSGSHVRRRDGRYDHFDVGSKYMDDFISL
jgi:hypothetical protein